MERGTGEEGKRGGGGLQQRMRAGVGLWAQTWKEEEGAAGEKPHELLMFVGS
jgi:hypothetical protein